MNIFLHKKKGVKASYKNSEAQTRYLKNSSAAPSPLRDTTA